MRKNKDKLNEFDQSKKIDSIKACLNYVVEYFDQYLSTENINFQTDFHNRKLQKYKKEIRHFNKEVMDWLTEIYDKYEKKLNLTVNYYLKTIDTLLLHNTDSEIQEITDNFYIAYVKRLPYIKNQQSNIFKLIKNIIDLKNSESIHSTPNKDFESLTIFEPSIIEWMKDTYNKYSVNLYNFACDYINKFSDKNPMGCDYNYKQEVNLFGIDLLFEKIKEKPYIKNHKTDFEMLLMFYWLDSIVGDMPYWGKYLDKLKQRRLENEKR